MREKLFAGNNQSEQPQGSEKTRKSKDPSRNKFKVTAVQFCGRVSEYELNLENIQKWAEKASVKGCDLVLFPESSVTTRESYLISRSRLRGQMV